MQQFEARSWSFQMRAQYENWQLIKAFYIYNLKWFMVVFKFWFKLKFSIQPKNVYLLTQIQVDSFSHQKLCFIIKHLIAIDSFFVSVNFYNLHNISLWIFSAIVISLRRRMAITVSYSVRIIKVNMQPYTFAALRIVCVTVFVTTILFNF